jgi:hypothetical protein
MKNLCRIAIVFALVAVVLPFSTASASKRRAAAVYNPLNDLTCEISCSNGDTASKTVETRGGCLDACESFCGEQCELVNN